MPKSKLQNKTRAKRAKKKTTKKKDVVKKPKKKVEVKVDTPVDIEQQNNLKCIKYINTIRRSKDEDECNRAFSNLLDILMPKIQKIISRFNIPGYDASDVLQEALYALRYKAIKDYDKERGTGEGPAAFDKFALLCIRRHLATEFKSSYQNKKRVLNQSVSIDKETNSSSQNSSESEIYLSNIIADPDMGDIITEIGDREYYNNLHNILFDNLSKFEKEVYVLYAQKFSYEEIAEKINAKRYKIKVNIKGVDNALSRIKHKAHSILQNYERKDNPK